MTIDIIKLKTLATAAAANQYDVVALNDYGTAVPPATVLGLIAEIERHRQINAEGCKPDNSILLSGVPCAGAAPCRSLDTAEGCKPDLNISTRPSDTAVQAVLAERRRQLETEGYTTERDDQYTAGQLADAAGAYAFWAQTCNIQDFKVTTVPPSWPWHRDQWKPTDQRTMLVKAGALILAEIERLDRQQSLGVATAIAIQPAEDDLNRIPPPTAERTADLTDALPTVAVEGDQLVIRITTECLLHAVTCAPEWPVDYRGEPVSILNGTLLIQEIIHELQREDEQGTNQMHRLLDQAALDAINNGSEAVSYD